MSDENAIGMNEILTAQFERIISKKNNKRCNRRNKKETPNGWHDANSKFHESSLFWIRLQKLYASTSHSHQSLADAVGVERKTIQRLLAGETYRDAVKLIYDVAVACGSSADVLFDSEKDLPVVSLTGIGSIDRMLTTIHNVTSRAHVESYRPFVHSDYLMFRGQDEEFTGGETRSPWRPTEGITYKQELDANMAVARENGTERFSKLRKAYIAGEQVVAVTDVSIRHISEESQGRITPADNRWTMRPLRVARFIEHMELERPLREYAENGRLVPKIIRRHWAEIKRSERE